MAKRWYAGYLMCIAAGVTVLMATAMPWAQLESPAVSYDAVQLQLYKPLAFALVTGVALIAFGLMRTMWAAFVALGAAFMATIVSLMIHEDVYVGLSLVQPNLALGQAPHVTGFGVAVMFAAGMLAGAAGLVIAVQAAPPAITSERSAEHA